MLIILVAVFLGLAFLGQIFSVFSAIELRNTIDQNTIPHHDLSQVSNTEFLVIVNLSSL